MRFCMLADAQHVWAVSPLSSKQAKFGGKQGAGRVDDLTDKGCHRLHLGLRQHLRPPLPTGTGRPWMSLEQKLIAECQSADPVVLTNAYSSYRLPRAHPHVQLLQTHDRLGDMSRRGSPTPQADGLRTR